MRAAAKPGYIAPCERSARRYRNGSGAADEALQEENSPAETLAGFHCIALACLTLAQLFELLKARQAFLVALLAPRDASFTRSSAVGLDE